MSSLIKKYSLIIFVSRIAYQVSREGKERKKDWKNKSDNYSSFCLTIPIKFTLINKAFYNFLKVYPMYFFCNIFLFLLNMIIVPITPIKKPIGQAKIAIRKNITSKAFIR